MAVVTSRVKQLDNGDYVDRDGKVLDGADYVSMLVPRKQKWLLGNWIMGLQESFQEIAKMDLTGEQFKVLFYLMSRTDFENYLNITQSEIAKELGMKQSQISRSFKALVEKNLIKKVKKGSANFYLFNPEILYKGRKHNYGKVISMFDRTESQSS